MKTETLYRRVMKGKRVTYEPVMVEIYDLDKFPKGFHLLHMTPGQSSYRYNVNPDIAAVLAAMHLAKEPMAEAMRQANQYAPEKREHTKAQQAALDEYLRLRKERLAVFCGVSMHDVVDAGIKALEELAKGDRMQLVIDHAGAMYRTLTLPKNAAKGGWRDMSPYDLLRKLEEETSELHGAVWGWQLHGEPIERVVSESADVSNIAAMTADVCKFIEEGRNATVAEEADQERGTAAISRRNYT